MNKRLFAAIACLSVVFTSTFAADAAKPHQKQLVILQAPTAASQGVRTIQAQVLVNASPSLVWNVLTQYSDIDTYMPGYQKSDVVGHQGASKLVNVEVKPAPFAPTYRYQMKALEYPQAYRLIFERTQGDMKFMKAQYQLTPRNLGKQTLITYTLSIDPGSNMPGTNSVLKSHTERQLYALSSYSEEMSYKSLIGQR